jgi:hypothetical protein
MDLAAGWEFSGTMRFDVMNASTLHKAGERQWLLPKQSFAANATNIDRKVDPETIIPVSLAAKQSNVLSSLLGLRFRDTDSVLMCESLMAETRRKNDSSCEIHCLKRHIYNSTS